MSDDVRKDQTPTSPDEKSEVKQPEKVVNTEQKAEVANEAAPKSADKSADGERKPAAEPAAKPEAAAKPAAKPKKEAPPDPRVEAAKALAEKMKTAVTAQLGNAVIEEAGNAHHKPMLLVRTQDWLRVVDFFRTDENWQLNYVECMAGADYPDYLEVVIYVQSMEKGYFVCLKTRTPRDRAEVPTLTTIFPGVDWEEREIFDLLGVNFTNHPDMRRIMMWDDFEGYPLRKDYSESD
jgi:NADH-quinone oxidoreductase subunit C